MSLLTPADIKRIAAERGLSMRTVCARAGIAPSTWARWQAGRTSPTLDVYTRLLAALKPRSPSAGSDDATKRAEEDDGSSPPVQP